MNQSPPNSFALLAGINVNDKVEKKNGLSYLSWAWAVDQLLRNDPTATWSFAEPARWGDTVMVFCTVTAFGKALTMQLPVMDHRNKAIPNPDAFAVNTAMMRCLTKAISLHGLGLYIYAGEDLPADDGDPKAPPPPNPPPTTGKPVAPVIPMATHGQKMDVAGYLINETTKAKATEAMVYYEKEHGVNPKTFEGMTAKMAETIITKCKAILNPAPN